MDGWRDRLSSVQEQMKWAVLFAMVLSALTTVRDLASMQVKYAGQDEVRVAFWVWSVAAQLTLFLFWAFVSPIVLAVMQRARSHEWKRLSSLLAYIALYGILGVLFYCFNVMVNLYVYRAPVEAATWGDLVRWQWFTAVMLNSVLKYYLPILLGGALYAYHLQARADEVKAAELREQLMQAQFRVLKMQLHPHFLFNALHSISTLVYTDPKRADRMIAQLSELLRLSLEGSNVVTVPLREELEYLKKYLEIERIRFSDRLETRFSIAPDTLALEVPNFILQPLVENAIKHGLSKQASDGMIHVMAYRESGGMVLAVEDNGPGFGRSKRGGIGTQNIRERLTRLYPLRARITLSSRHPTGVRQEIFIPVDDIDGYFERPVADLSRPDFSTAYD